MSTPEVTLIARDLLTTAMWLAGPSVLVSLLVGLIVALFQTVTSIQEQTLSFAPRIVAVWVVMLFTLPWMINLSTSFAMRMMERMLEVAG